MVNNEKNNLSNFIWTWETTNRCYNYFRKSVANFINLSSRLEDYYFAYYLKIYISTKMKLAICLWYAFLLQIIFRFYIVYTINICILIINILQRKHMKMLTLKRKHKCNQCYHYLSNCMNHTLKKLDKWMTRLWTRAGARGVHKVQPHRASRFWISHGASRF